MPKHFLHVYYGCGKQFEVAVSLNHDVMTCVSTPHVTQLAHVLGHNCVRLLPHAYGQHMNVLKYFAYI